MLIKGFNLALNYTVLVSIPDAFIFAMPFCFIGLFGGDPKTLIPIDKFAFEIEARFS